MNDLERAIDEAAKEGRKAALEVLTKLGVAVAGEALEAAGNALRYWLGTGATVVNAQRLVVEDVPRT